MNGWSLPSPFSHNKIKFTKGLFEDVRKNSGRVCIVEYFSRRKAINHTYADHNLEGLRFGAVDFANGSGCQQSEHTDMVADLHHRTFAHTIETIIISIAFEVLLT